jgi:TRAP-type C4-dicarboxylate transport system permease small subunit
MLNIWKDINEIFSVYLKIKDDFYIILFSILLIIGFLLEVIYIIKSIYEIYQLKKDNKKLRIEIEKNLLKLLGGDNKINDKYIHNFKRIKNFLK